MGTEYRSADSSEPNGADSPANRFGMSRATSGPRIPPLTIPIDGLETSATPTATPAPTMAATSSRRPVISPTASPIIAAGKMTSMPSRPGSGICAPSTTPARVARIHVKMPSGPTAASQ